MQEAVHLITQCSIQLSFACRFPDQLMPLLPCLEVISHRHERAFDTRKGYLEEHGNIRRGRQEREEWKQESLGVCVSVR